MAMVEQLEPIRLIPGLGPHLETAFAPREIERFQDAFVQSWIRAGQQSVIEHEFKLFQDRYGKIFADDPCYEQRAHYFLDEFCFGALPTQRAAPLQDWLTGLGPRCPEILRQFYHQLWPRVTAHHSFFQIARIDRRLAKCVDLVDGRVTERQLISFGEHGCLYQRGIVYQGFMFVVRDNFYLSPGMFAHPIELTPTLRRFLRRNRRAFQERKLLLLAALHHLSQCQLRCSRHAGAKANPVYGRVLADLQAHLQMTWS